MKVTLMMCFNQSILKSSFLDFTKKLDFKDKVSS